MVGLEGQAVYTERVGKAAWAMEEDPWATGFRREAGLEAFEVTKRDVGDGMCS